MGLKEDWEEFKTDMGQTVTFSSRKAAVVIVVISTIFLGWIFAPIAWLICSVGIYYAGSAFIRLRKQRKSDADPQGLFGFGLSNDQYILIGIAVIFFIASAYFGFIGIPALVSGIAFYAILKCEAELKGQTVRLKRHIIDDW